MSQDTTMDATQENSLGFSNVQNDMDNEFTDSEERLMDTSTDLPQSQNVSSSATTGGGGKGRLDVLRENLSKQQERLLALRERANRSTDDGQSKSIASESMDSLKTLGLKLKVFKSRSTGSNVAHIGVGDVGEARNETLDSNYILSEMANRNVSTPITTPSKDENTSAHLISGSTKLQMLTQRTEQNRALLEQRKRDMAKSLLSVKSGLSSTSGELGSSMTDLRTTVPVSNAPVSRHRSAADLQLQLQQQTPDQYDEGRLKLLKNKIKLNEMKQSRKEQELQQELLEIRSELAKREQTIEKMTLSAAELQNTLELQSKELESLRQVGIEVSSDAPVIELADNTKLQIEIDDVRKRNSELENINEILETTRCELHDELRNAQEKLSSTKVELHALQQQRDQPIEQPTSMSSAATTDAQVNAELAKQVQELEKQLETLQAENEKLRSDNAAAASMKMDVSDAGISDRLAALEITIEAQRAELEERANTIREQEEDLAEKITELNVLNVNLRVLEDKLIHCSKTKPIFLPTAVEGDENSEELQAELKQLKQKLDESNKTNIKLKLKCKQTEKQMVKIKNSSDLHVELTRLTEENEKLQQRIIVLEDEKGQWQLSQMQETGSSEDEIPTATDFGKQQAETIRLLEEQKQELQQTLEALQQGNESARVESELSEVQLEEQLSQRVQELETEAADQLQKLQSLKTEKDALDKKLSHYINENMELLDKLEKLSSSSSAESIEIVERPTQHEHADLDCFNQRRSASHGDEHAHQDTVEGSADVTASELPSFVSELTQTDMTSELSENFAQMRDENAELIKKIELFSTERREVLEKMENLNAENIEMQAKLEQYENEAQHLERAKSKLEQELDELNREKQLWSLDSSVSSSHKGLTSMQKSSEVVAALDCGEGPALFDKCEKSLSKLNSELESYRKANDRNAKFNVSKKLAREAKNVHTQLTELLQKVKEASNAVETVTVVETVVAVTAPNGKALAEYEQLTAQNAELKATVAALEREICELGYQQTESQLALKAEPEVDCDHEEKLKELEAQCAELQSTVENQREQLRESLTAADERVQQITEYSAEIASLQKHVEQFDHVMNAKEMSHEKHIEQLTRVRRELEGKIETYEGEMSILQTLVAEQKQQLIEAYSENEHKINLKLLEIQQYQDDIEALRKDLAIQQRSACDDDAALNQECAKLRESLKAQKSLASQQVNELANKQESIDTLNQQISELYQTLEERALSLFEAEEEIKKLKQNSEPSQQAAEEAQEKLRLEAALANLTESHAASEARNKELREKLKKFAANLKKRGTEVTELEAKLAVLRDAVTTAENNNKLLVEQQRGSEHPQVEPLIVESSEKLLNMERSLQEEQSVVAKLNEELKHKIHTNLENRDVIKKLKQELEEATQKSNQLYRQIDSLQAELHNAVQDHAILRHKYDLQQVKWDEAEREWHERLEASEHAISVLKSTQTGDINRSIEDLRRQLEQKTIKFDKSKEVIKHRNATIQSLQRELNELRNQLQVQPEEAPIESTTDKSQAYDELLEKYDALQQQHARLGEQYTNEKSTFEQTIARLETLHDGIQAKLQQDLSYIETIEAENSDLKAKTNSLEEQATSHVQNHAAMLDRMQLLEEQLQACKTQYEEHEQQLQQSLEILAKREQSQSQELDELKSDANHGRQQFNELQATYDALLAKYNKLAADAQLDREHLTSRSEQELQELRDRLAERESELQRQRAVYDAKLAAKATELDELECDLSAHMQRATTETRDITQQLERSHEYLEQKSDELARLNEELIAVERERANLSREVTYLRMQQDSAEQDAIELQELRMQALQDKTEMDNLRSQIDSLCANHYQELQALQQQIAELDTLGQNQTDDEVYIQTENRRLAEQLAELQHRLDQYERAPSEEQARELADGTEQVARLQSEIIALREATANAAGDLLRDLPVAQAADVIAAPSMFFGSDLAVPSPFDEIMQPRLVATQQGVAPPSASAFEAPAFSSSSEQPTIEDLQRNVSDLEKHAQDLEAKLLSHNQAMAERQREAATQERQQQQLEHYLGELKAALEERDARLNALEAQHKAALQAATARLTELEKLLSDREHEITQLRIAESERERLAAVEKQIQPNVASAAPTLDMFFGGPGESAIDVVVEASLGSSFGLAEAEPVNEEIITPKKAYICHPSEQVVDWGVDDDPWASAAVEQTTQSIDACRPSDDALTARVAELEQQLVAAEQQKVELQTKTIKLMKRIKEYKSKAATVESAVGFNDLDNAIIDELKNQIQLHEAKQAKTEELLQQNALEKEKLNKRIEVLTAGNDRMTELKERQDMDVQMYQARIRELQDKLNQLDSWGEDAATTASATPITTGLNAEQLAKIDNLQAENQDLYAECQQLQTQLKQSQEATTQSLAERQQHCDQIEQLTTELEKLQTKIAEQRAQSEAKELDYQKQIAAAHALAIAESSPATPSDEHVAQVQEKEAEIVHLKQRIEELMREDQTEKLVLEILTKNQELHLLRMQVKQLVEDKHELEISKSAELEEASNRALQLQLEELRLQNGLLEQEKADMEEELRILNNHVLSSLELEDKMKQSVLELDIKSIEITELRKSLDALQQTPQPAQQAPPVDTNALNQQWQAIVDQKCSEVARMWQEHLTQREADFKSVETELHAKIAELTAAMERQTKTSSAETSTNQPATGMEHISYNVTTDYSDVGTTNDVNDMLMKMQKALETQEMEIVTLKEQLAIRSAEYARLAAQYDPFRLQNTLSSAGATQSTQDPLPEYVLKADLDYALMMVHQRDIRIEEMILELVQLLEERDHLQLKLSDTLRQLETERVRTHDDSIVSNAITSSANAASGSSSRITSSSDLSSVTSSSSSDLKQKLAELQTVKHFKDKAIVDEREQRLHQMMQLQKDMAKPAPTATATTAAPEPIGVDLSQPSLRSPSMVLMDWILGNKNDEKEDIQQPHN